MTESTTCLAVQCQDPPTGDDHLCDKHRKYARRKERPGIPTRIVGDLRARLMAKIEIDPVTGCWNWTASISTNGYGQIMMPDKKPRRAHRAMYELVKGPIPDGLWIDHLCRNIRCCNPDHLEPVPPVINTRRGEAVKATDTHCANGHSWAEGDNERIRPSDGARECRACNRDKAARYRQRRDASRRTA